MKYFGNILIIALLLIVKSQFATGAKPVKVKLTGSFKEDIEMKVGNTGRTEVISGLPYEFHITKEDYHLRPHVGKSIAQVGLRWLQQQGVDVIPMTTHKERMQENMDIIDFELTAGEMQRIKTLDTGRSQFGWR